jgi:hypothetical protein
MSGRGGIPSAWRSPTTRCPGGNILAPLSAELAMLAPGAPGGSPRGGRWDATPHPLPGLTLVSAIPEACRGAGRRAPALIPLNLVSGSAQDADLLIID